MSQFSITHEVPRHLVWLILISWLAACSTSPSSSGDQQPSAALAERIQQLEAVGDYAGIATLYLSLEGSPQQRREWQLRAAEAHLNGNDPQRALETIVALDDATLSLEQQTRYQMVQARAELLLNGPEAAALRLPSYSATLPPAVAVEVLQTRIDILAASGRREEELLDRLTLDAVAAGQPTVQERNREGLWRLIQDMPEEQLLTLVSLDPALAGWVALQRAAAVPIDDRDAFDEQISNWWARFPNHVASGRARTIEQARSAPQRASQVALLLPLSGRYSGVGNAVHQGFMTALSNDFSQQPLVRVYDTESTDPNTLYRLALSDGADAIVGPLLKERVAQIAQIQDLEVPLLALNRIALEGSLDASFYQFGLVPEDEARQIALDALARGQTRALVLYPTEQPEADPESASANQPPAEAETAAATGTPAAAIAPEPRALSWGERLRDAFVGSYTQATGEILAIESYSTSSTDFTRPITALLELDASEARHADLQRRLGRNLEFEPRRRQDANLIFLAATANQARQVFPQLRFHRIGDLPVVATSHVYSERPDPIRDRDLDGLHHLEIPWIVDRGRTPLGQFVFAPTEAESATESSAPAEPDNAELRPRLFAMGADAFHLLPWLSALKVSTGATLNGATGALSSDAEGRIRRRLLWANFENGLVVLSASEDESAPQTAEGTATSGSELLQ